MKICWKFFNWSYLGILLFLGVFASSNSFGNPFHSWSVRSPLPFGGDFHDITFGNGKFVGVGYYGLLATSSNGISWQVQNSSSGSHLLDVTFGNGLWVAVDLAGYSIVSSNGSNWTRIKTPVKIEGLGFGTGLFLGGGYDGTNSFGIVTSPDGINWTRTATITGNVTQVIYADGRYVATGYGGKIFVSTNLTDWSISNTGGEETHNGICYGNGRYVAVGAYSHIFVSTNAVDWVKIDPGPGMRDVQFLDGKFIAVGDGLSQGMISSNGLDWSIFTIQPTRYVAFNSAAFGNGRFVTGGPSGQVCTSEDGTNWIPRFQGSTVHLYGCAHDGSEWLAAGVLQELIGSTNGFHWTTYRRQVGLGQFTSIHYGNGIYVATYEGSGLGSILSSQDRLTWTEHFVTATPPFYNSTFGHTNWLAVGAYGLLGISSNGTNWQQYWLGSEHLTSIAFAQNKFVIVGDQGTIFTSEDSTQWFLENSGTNAHLNSVAYGNGVFVAVGVNGTVLTSTNGITWVVRPSITPKVLTGVAFGDGHFVTVGADGIIFISKNGSQWTQLSSPTTLHLFNVAFGDHSFLAVGLGGVVIQSDPLIRLDVANTSPVTFSVSGPLGRTLEMQGRTNVATGSWQSISTVTLTNSPTLWTDFSNPEPMEFFRASLVPIPD